MTSSQIVSDVLSVLGHSAIAPFFGAVLVLRLFVRLFGSVIFLAGSGVLDTGTSGFDFGDDFTPVVFRG